MPPFSLASPYSGNLLLTFSPPHTAPFLLRNGAHAAPRTLHLRIRSWRRGVEAMGDQRGVVRRDVRAHVPVLPMAARTPRGVYRATVRFGSGGTELSLWSERCPTTRAAHRPAEVPGGTRPRWGRSKWPTFSPPFGRSAQGTVTGLIAPSCARRASFCPSFLPGKAQTLAVPGAARPDGTKPAPAGSARPPLTFLDVGSGRSQRPHPLARGAMAPGAVGAGPAQDCSWCRSGELGGRGKGTRLPLVQQSPSS